jgi:hypothetical protein
MRWLMSNPEETDPAAARSREVDTRGVLLSGFGLAAGLIASLVLMWGLFRVLEKRQERVDKPLPPQVVINLKRIPPEPRLEPDPLALRRELRAQEDALLKSYGWVDRTAGSVHIPIDRAMEIVLERGVPGGKPMAAGAPAPAAMPNGAQPK